MEKEKEIEKEFSKRTGYQATINVSGKPSWDNAPEWAKWLAQSADGIWDWFETKPKAYNFGLYVKGTFMCAGKGKKECATKGTHILTRPNKEWRKTIEKRPTITQDNK
jgi:hypothetical protein